MIRSVCISNWIYKYENTNKKNKIFKCSNKHETSIRTFIAFSGALIFRIEVPKQHKRVRNPIFIIWKGCYKFKSLTLSEPLLPWQSHQLQWLNDELVTSQPSIQHPQGPSLNASGTVHPNQTTTINPVRLNPIKDQSKKRRVLTVVEILSAFGLPLV